MLHIGSRIKSVFDSQPKKCTVDWFANELNCQRANVYNIFRRQTVDTELLWRISKILHHDFFADYSANLKHLHRSSVSDSEESV